MGGKEILLLGLGIQAPWQLVDQHLDVDKQLPRACPVLHRRIHAAQQVLVGDVRGNPVPKNPERP